MFHAAAGTSVAARPPGIFRVGITFSLRNHDCMVVFILTWQRALAAAHYDGSD